MSLKKFTVVAKHGCLVKKFALETISTTVSYRLLPCECTWYTKTFSLILSLSNFSPLSLFLCLFLSLPPLSACFCLSGSVKEFVCLRTRIFFKKGMQLIFSAIPLKTMLQHSRSLMNAIYKR